MLCCRNSTWSVGRPQEQEVLALTRRDRQTFACKKCKKCFRKDAQEFEERLHLHRTTELERPWLRPQQRRVLPTLR